MQGSATLQVLALQQARRALALLALLSGPALAVQDMPGVVLERAARDTVPTYDQLVRGVLTLKVQVEALRARIRDPQRAVDAWRPPTWVDSLRAIRANLALLGASTGRLEAMYRADRNKLGQRIAGELHRLVERAYHPVDSLARTASEASARTTATHLAASIEALLQKIAEGEACCPTARPR